MIEMEKVKKDAWQNSILAPGKFDKDMRRKNLVREIFNEGVDAGYSAAAQSGWVDVEERLPKYGGEYLVTVDSSFVGLDAVETDTWVLGDGHWQNHGRKVIAWMEKPPPYQREGGE